MSQNIIPSFKDLKTKFLLKFHLADLRLNESNTFTILLDKNIHNLDDLTSMIQNTTQSPLFSKAKNLLIKCNDSFSNSYTGDSNISADILWEMYDNFRKFNSQNKIIIVVNSLKDQSLYVINKDIILSFNINHFNNIINFQDYMFSFENEKIIDPIKVETLIYSDQYAEYQYRVEFNKENKINSFEAVGTAKYDNYSSINLSSSDISLQTYNNPAIITGVVDNVLEQVNKFFS